jgi:hypothetical protein
MSTKSKDKETTDLNYLLKALFGDILSPDDYNLEAMRTLAKDIENELIENPLVCLAEYPLKGKQHRTIIRAHSHPHKPRAFFKWFPGFLEKWPELKLKLETVNLGGNAHSNPPNPLIAVEPKPPVPKEPEPIGALDRKVMRKEMEGFDRVFGDVERKLDDYHHTANSGVGDDDPVFEDTFEDYAEQEETLEEESAEEAQEPVDEPASITSTQTIDKPVEAIGTLREQARTVPTPSPIASLDVGAKEQVEPEKRYLINDCRVVHYTITAKYGKDLGIGRTVRDIMHDICNPQAYHPGIKDVLWNKIILDSDYHAYLAEMSADHSEDGKRRIVDETDAEFRRQMYKATPLDLYAEA